MFKRFVNFDHFKAVVKNRKEDCEKLFPYCKYKFISRIPKHYLEKSYKDEL